MHIVPTVGPSRITVRSRRLHATPASAPSRDRAAEDRQTVKARCLKSCPSLFASLLLAVMIGSASDARLFAQQSKPAPRVPHNQDRPPGPALSPEQAIAAMQVPPGFQVELVASEPDLINPIAIAFDERGRAWVTESIEYPRRQPGVGKDRIKVLEDRDGDGRMETVSVFADGLNIPSGIAVGYGGVWVANAPDLLFLQDTDGDGKADKREVIVTGFGRDDTHELPNAFTWGPDGWLYGLNGVFNHCRVNYPPTSPLYRKEFPGWNFNCAMYRVHPRTKEFQIFCEGTSNPWGIAFDHDGSAFVSACVIDHLWHLVQNGYYHRQAGAYPAFTWKIESIVRHKHQKAAYCGITYYDSDAYPPEYRNRLFMGNIHGNCVNSDALQKQHSTYLGTLLPDFLSANDSWFMPVAQVTGPDGCLYVLDWYDQYHCYQDANRDPAGIERGKGRLYRVRYTKTPRPAATNLETESDTQLIARLGSGNGYLRETARRLLAEHNRPDTADTLRKLVVDSAAPSQARRQALWALQGMTPDRAESTWILKLTASDSCWLRAWGIRWLANRDLAWLFLQSDAIARLTNDPEADVRLQLAIAAGRLPATDPQAVPVLMALAGKTAPEDPLLPRMIWRGLEPRLELQADALTTLLAKDQAESKSRFAALARLQLIPRIAERLLATPKLPVATVSRLLELGFESDATRDVAVNLLKLLAQKLQTGELPAAAIPTLQSSLQPVLSSRSGPLSQAPESEAFFAAAMVATAWRSDAGMSAARTVLQAKGTLPERRLAALQALVAAKDEQVLTVAGPLLTDAAAIPIEWREKLLTAFGPLDTPGVADLLLAQYSKLEPGLQSRAVELLTGRVSWGRRLLTAIGQKQLPAAALNVNQVRKLLALKDAELSKLVTEQWGRIREDRNPAREQVITQMRTLLRQSPGDPVKGQAVYQKVCGQCHKIHGQGAEVGPDITLNGRSSFEQLLSNVFDPNLVIGADYQARIVLTTEGRVITGLLVEDSPQRIVLKVQGGKQEIIPRNQVEEFTVSKLSLMPEDLEKQYQSAEWVDLFAFLTLDKPPSDPTARRLPGSQPVQPRETTDPKQFPELVEQVAPGFTLEGSGEGGVAILADHFGRPGVLRTHPIREGVPAILRRKIDLPAGRSAKLIVDVSHHPQGDWQLIVRANGQVLTSQSIGLATTQDHWREVTVDLTSLAGKSVVLELLNQPSGWSYEFGYWGRVDLLLENPRP